jgi:CheY-like chemotaxis protein
LVRFQERASEVTLALVDQSMPGMTGVDTIAHLRRFAPQLPAGLMSGFARETVPATFLDQPRTEFLTKPFEPEQLRGLVERLAGSGSPQIGG